MKEKTFRLAIAVVITAMASLGGNAQLMFTPEMAVQRVIEMRTSQGLGNDSANFYIAETDTLINKFLESEIPSETELPQWASEDVPKYLVYVREKPLEACNTECNYYYLPQSAQYGSEICHIPGTGFPVGVCFTSQRIVPQSITKLANRNLIQQGKQKIYSAGYSTKFKNETEVILMAEPDVSDVYTKSYNDCMTFYDILVNVYDIPEKNIHLLLGTGNPGNDKVYDSDGTLVEPLYIDGVMPATNAHLSYVCSQIAKKSANKVRHLFFLGSGNGEITSKKDIYEQSYFCCMDGNELSEDLNRIAAKHNTAIMVNRGSGYTLPGLNNLVGIHSTFTSEQPFVMEQYIPWSPIVYIMGSAFSGMDLMTGASVNADADGNGTVSMYEAFSYLMPGDSAIGYNEYSYYRFLRDNGDIAGNRSFDLMFDRDVIKPRNRIEMYQFAWDSPDIWIRNQDDGIANQTQDMVDIKSGGKKYIYVRLNNVSEYDYKGSGLSLNLSWKKNILGKTSNYATNSIATLPITDVIKADSSIIVMHEWDVPEQLSKYAKYQNSPFPLTVVADVNTHYQMISDTAAQKRVIHFNPCLGNPKIYYLPAESPLMNNFLTYYRTNFPLYIPGFLADMRVGVVDDEQIGTMDALSKLRVGLELSPKLYSIWQFNGGEMSEASLDSYNENSVILENEYAVIKGLDCYKDSLHVFTEASFNTSQSAKQDKFYIVLQDNKGHVIDGATVHVDIPAEGTLPVIPIINCVSKDDGSVQLLASNIEPSSNCEWFHDAEEPISHDKSLTLDSDQATGQVVLVTRDGDGRGGIASVNLEDLWAIAGIDTNDAIHVTLNRPAGRNMEVKVVSITDGSIVSQTSVEEGRKEISLDANRMDSRPYAVVLSHNGQIVDQKSIVLQ